MNNEWTVMVKDGQEIRVRPRGIEQMLKNGWERLIETTVVDTNTPQPNTKKTRKGVKNEVH